MSFSCQTEHSRLFAFHVDFLYSHEHPQYRKELAPFHRDKIVRTRHRRRYECKFEARNKVIFHATFGSDFCFRTTEENS